MEVLLFGIVSVTMKGNAIKKSHIVKKSGGPLRATKQFQCVCDRGGNIYLGLYVGKTINVIGLLCLVFLIGMSFYDQDFGIQTAALSLIVLGLYTWNYVEIYHDMKRHKHSTICSKACARAGVWYQFKGSAHTIMDPRP